MKPIIVIMLLMVGCTTPYQAKELDLELEAKAQVGDAKVGINGKGQVILQEEKSASDELNIQRQANFYMKERLESDHFALQSCVRDLANPKVGGKGDYEFLPELNLKSPAEEKEEFGQDEEGNLKLVKKSFFIEELKSERKYQKSIETMHRLVKRQLEKCENALMLARTNSGLPEKKVGPQGYVTPSGDWVQTKGGEE